MLFFFARARRTYKATSGPDPQIHPVRGPRRPPGLRGIPPRQSPARPGKPGRRADFPPTRPGKRRTARPSDTPPGAAQVMNGFGSLPAARLLRPWATPKASGHTSLPYISCHTYPAIHIYYKTRPFPNARPPPARLYYASATDSLKYIVFPVFLLFIRNFDTRAGKT